MLPRFSLAIAIAFIWISLAAQVDTLSVVEQQDMESRQPAVYLQDIKNWLQEKHSETSENVFDDTPLYADNGDIYHNGYLYISRPNLAPTYRYGFEQAEGVFSQGLYHAYYHSLYPASSQDYRMDKYPYAPALTTIHGSLGDYDHRYARVSFKKNYMLGYPDLCYQGDLLVQSGLWTDIISAETSVKNYLSFDLGNYSFETEYSSMAKDVAMTELLPVYWLDSNFKVSHQLRQFYASVKNPFAGLSVITSRESATAISFEDKLLNNSTQVKFNLYRDTGVDRYEAYYEHAFRNSNTDFVGSFDTDSYKQKLGVQWDKYMPIGLGLKADWLDWKRGRLHSDVNIPVFGSSFGAFANALLGEDASPDSVLNIYTFAGYFPLLDQSKRHEEGIYYRYEWLDASSQLTVGSQNIIQSAPLSGFDREENQLFVRFALDMNHKWRNWQLKAREQWIWAKVAEGLCESPEYRFQSQQNLFYNLPWGNSFVAGFGVSGHSGYYAANAVSPNLIEASSVLDAWGGFNIDALFELRAGVKNALSSTIYGAYPMPWSLYVEVRWAFAN